MTTEVKICGLTHARRRSMRRSPAAPITSASCSIHRSPRNVAPAERARSRRTRARPRRRSWRCWSIPTMLCSIDRDRHRRAGSPPAARSETPERVAEIAHRFGRPVMKAVAVADRRRRRSAALAYAGKRRPHPVRRQGAALTPRRSPAATASPSTGSCSLGLTGALDFMLAGGLTPANVGEAHPLTGARAVDVSSGVESAPGRKGPGADPPLSSCGKTAKQTA